jgi:serine/threonine protein kinase
MSDDSQVDRGKVVASTAVTKQEVRVRRTTPAGRPSAEAVDMDRRQAALASRPSQAPPLREVLAPGTKVARYEIIRLVGEGGMGAVYEAMDERLGRKVALKILAASLKGKRKAAKRFAIEAKAAARLDHPNVVGVFDFDVECEIPYIAMDFLQGETLASAIARGPLAFDRLADIMLAVCAGAYAAHQAGIVHRDLKPSNIFLCSDWKGKSTARVLDFGISKVGGISSSRLTQTGDIVGTSQYLSPEQASGLRDVDAFSDQYSLGVVMYECVTQRPPHKGEPMFTLLRNVSEGHHALPHELRLDLPPELEAIIERAMRVRPRDRFPSVYLLGRALFPFASIEGQRQFDDFYNGGEISDRSSAVSLERKTDKERVSPNVLVTERLPSNPAPTWQKKPTRTSTRPSGSKQRVRRPSSSIELDVSNARSSRLRMVIYSVALGAILAIATLIIAGLLIRPGALP